MAIKGFDCEPERIVVIIDRPSGTAIGPCDMVRDKEGKCFLVPYWILTHDGNVPATMIPIDPSLLEPRRYQNFPNEKCKYLYKGLVRLSDDNKPL
jgi:hypothetical protein